MIIVTGAAGFIGSYLVGALNRDGYNNIVVVDDFSNEVKNSHLEDKNIIERVHRDDFVEWIDGKEKTIEFIFHLGARTDTAEFDMELLDRLNTDYSKKVWSKCVEYQIPLVYASSAATYGLGEYGYKDSEDIIDELKPLNPYGVSKNEFDKWVIRQEETPFFWAGLKFFNVYGPGEDHKGRMASVIWHAYHQISKTGKMKLFRSHNPDFKDGEQMRDFVYVEDVANVMLFLMHQRKDSSIYNLGSGTARTFLDLTRATFSAMGIPEEIEFIDTPIDIRDKYQYYTKADMSKIESVGYQRSFTSLEEGVKDYVQNELMIKYPI